MTHRANVAVVEWCWGGHNHTYYKHYLAALVESGAFVIPVMSQPDLLPSMLSSAPLATIPNSGRSISAPVEFSPSPLKVFRPTRVFLQSAFFMRAWSTHRRLGDALRQWELQTGQSIDLVFFACMFEHEFQRVGMVSNSLRRPWSGLYLQGRAFHRLRAARESRRLRKAKVMFGSKRLVALGVLEPAVLQIVGKALPALNVRQFPDTLEESVESETEAALQLRQDMLAKAAGRRIVSLLGWLQPSKGVELFLRAACDPRLDDVMFFLGGPLLLHDFEPVPRRRVQELLARAPHLHIRNERLCENMFNAAVRTSDVLFASYTDFPYSSNLQGKAAQLHTPMIVTQGTLMAERCEKYRLGECIPENDLEALVSAIRRLVAKDGKRQHDAETVALQDSYAALNTYPHVRSAMDWVLRSAGL